MEPLLKKSNDGQGKCLSLFISVWFEARYDCSVDLPPRDGDIALSKGFGSWSSYSSSRSMIVSDSHSKHKT
jgi:hypothetical protein